MKTIAVLLTVHNRKDKTLSCLENVFGQSMPEGFCTDVWLVDDGCTDGTAEAIGERFPQVHVLKGDGNLYWNRGMILAWQSAAESKVYDYYLWLNDDSNIYGYCLKTLLETSAVYADKAIVVGSTYDTVSRSTLTYGGRNAAEELVVPKGEAEEVEMFNGNIVLVPAYVYQHIGTLDNYFTHSKGDFDYGLRAKKAGIKMILAGKVLGECDKHASLDDWCNPSVPFSKRWKLLHKPTGMPPKETFHLESRHYGMFIASVHFITIYMRCLFPVLWKFKNFHVVSLNNINNSTTKQINN